MRKMLLSPVLWISMLGITGLQLMGAQAIDASGMWLATDFPYAPWTVQLKQDGTKLTGTMEQNGGLRGAAQIYEGAINGSTISFKANSPDGARAITFTGAINGNEITLNRSTRLITNGSAGGTGLFGSNAAQQFTIRRGSAPSTIMPAAGATSVTSRAASKRINFKGVEVDITSIQSAPNLDIILDGLRRQIDIVDRVAAGPALKAFLKSVPLVMAASPGTPSDAAAYSRATKNVVLQSLSYGPEKPVILHELMHAYHDQELPGGFANAAVVKLYQQARSSGQFPAESYMLSNAGEYFAMMASVYLHGSAVRDPFTRQAIKEKQPDCYQWFEKEFGPR